MNVKKPPERVLSVIVATCINKRAHESLTALAASSGVNMATYLRAIIADAIAEEALKPKRQIAGRISR